MRIGLDRAQREVRIGRSAFPVVLPSLHDPRLQLAAVIMSIHLLGQVALDFRVSVPQIAAAILTCFAIEAVVTFVRDRSLVWPASAMLTGSGVALIMRDVGTEAGDHWTFRSWWLFAAVAALSLATKYLIRWQGSHVFNPSNIGLVIAFLALGSDRIEPLDFWWGPFDGWMLLAYTIIITGGLLITHRLHLLEMAIAFWVTFAVCLGSLAVAGHCITARWSVTPVCDGHFWWVLVTSPEVLVFLFFMITDPKTTPGGRGARIWFGMAVAVVCVVLIAPQQTEFAAKVALLGGLVAVCGLRLVVDRLAHSPRAEERWRSVDAAHPKLAVGARGTKVAVGALAVVAAAGVLVGVAAAGAPAREASLTIEAGAFPDPRQLVPEIADDRVPEVSSDPEVHVFGTHLLGPAARTVGIELIRALDIEALALGRGDPALLPAVDHARRLNQLRDRVEEATAGTLVVPEYAFDEMHLTVVRRGQAGARLGVEARGTVTEVTYDEDGDETGRTVSPFEILFVLNPGSDGRWFIADTLPLS